MRNRALLAIAGIGAVLGFGICQAQTFGANRLIHQERSLYRNILVLEGSGHRCLTFGRRSARQSCMNLAEPEKLVFGYTSRMFDALTQLSNPKRILIIGVGGGSLPMAARRRFPAARIDAVEIDPAVIDVARQYFNLREDNKLHLYSGDGRIFIRQQILRRITYDAILLDAFDKDYIPEHMATVEFLAQIRSSLAPDGLLLANTYSGTALQAHEEASFQRVFGVIQETRLNNGNRIILAGEPAARIAMNLADGRQVPASKAAVFTDKFAPANALLIH